LTGTEITTQKGWRHNNFSRRKKQFASNGGRQTKVGKITFYVLKLNKNVVKGEQYELAEDDVAAAN
jgi:hypothetical protein